MMDNLNILNLPLFELFVQPPFTRTTMFRGHGEIVILSGAKDLVDVLGLVEVHVDSSLRSV